MKEPRLEIIFALIQKGKNRGSIKQLSPSPRNCKPRKGLVKWARNVRVKTSCEMDIKSFPYDSQACPITISSQDNSNEYLKLSTRKWNRLNNVDENETVVIPNDIDTVKVSFVT